jgi:hypothetical protein
MKVILIEDFPVFFSNFKYLTPQAADYRVGRQQIVALYSILIGGKANTNHRILVPSFLEE